MKYSGIDLHSNNSVVVVSDEADRVVYRRRLPNELGKILEALEPHRRELAGVVVESTYNWYWLVDGLQAAGYRVQLAHTAAMKRYEGLKHSGDDTDAAQLAHLLRLDLLPTGYIYPAAERALRDLGRRRLQLVRHRTMHVLAVENVQARETGARMTGERVKRLNAQAVEAMGLPEDVALGMQANVAVIGTLNEEIAKLERHLLQRLKPRLEYALLSTAPGIGRILGPIILLETGAIERFAAVGNYASYARCVAKLTSARSTPGTRRSVCSFSHRHAAQRMRSRISVASRTCSPGAATNSRCAAGSS